MPDIQTSFRKRAIGASFALAALASLVPGDANAADISARDCGTIAEVSARVVRTLKPETLSAEFKRSMMDFVMPDRKTVTCTGTRDILTPTIDDIAAFNTIRTFLLAGSQPISLQKAGLRSVDPATLASAKPQPTKRSELTPGPAVN